MFAFVKNVLQAYILFLLQQSTFQFWMDVFVIAGEQVFLAKQSEYWMAVLFVPGEFADRQQWAPAVCRPVHSTTRLHVTHVANSHRHQPRTHA